MIEVCVTRQAPTTVLLAALLLLAIPLVAAAVGLLPSDYYEFEFVSELQKAPDGNTVAFVRSTISEDRRSRESAIWLVATDGSSPPRQFTRDSSDPSPRWSPDGRQLAFISRRQDRSQLHLIPLGVGEAHAVTQLEQGSIVGFEWLPDNRHVLLSLRIDPAVEDPDQKAAEETGPKPNLKRSPNAVYTSDDGGYLDESRVGLWLLDSEGPSLQRLTGHADWNNRNATVSPDGTLIAFDADRRGGEYAGGFNLDIFLLTLETAEVWRLETPSGRAWQPTFSPDGRQIYFHHQSERYAPTTLQPIAVGGGGADVMHDGLALTATDVGIPAAGQGSFLRADSGGARPLFRLDRSGRAIPLVGADATINGVSFSANGRQMAYVEEDETCLAEIFTARSDGSRVRQLARFNDELLGQRELQSLERFTFTNEEDMAADGFLLRPLGFREGQRFLGAVTRRSVSNWISEAGTQEYPPESMTAQFGGTIWPTSTTTGVARR